jgi:DNA-binding CsgD family transcriptional regulator
MPGPLQVIAVSFGPDADFEGRVLAEVDRLQGRGVLRLLDLLFVAKNEDGTIERLIVGDDEDFGALLSRILPLDGADLVAPAADDGSAGFDPSDALAVAESLLPGTALAFLLVEHGWAQPLFEAIAETGGELLGDGFLTADAGLLVGAEVAAMEEAAEVIAAAQSAEARAALRVMAAESDAAEAVAASEAIQAAAAAGAVRALIAAGIVEEAAAHEAVEALNAAGLIVTEAEEATAAAVAEDAAEVQAADAATAAAVAEDAAEVQAADEVAAAAVAEDAAEVQAADDATDQAVADDAAEVQAADAATDQAVAEDAAEVQAADAATDQAVAEDAATIRAASISMAEARVLRYLPTPLTFALIADKLGISRSAAKERAERAYKKLGVHSRAEAVSRARALGLID